MRKAERKIEDTERIRQIIKNCHMLTLALNGDGCPYVVPLNFGVKEEGGAWTLYFHGAGQGTKIDLMKADSRASFCIVSGESLELKVPACKTTMLYDSVCGTGTIEFVSEKEEKREALNCLMSQYDPQNAGNFNFQEEAIERVTIYKLVVKTITGKSNKAKA